jgi:hypothetical protein
MDTPKVPFPVRSAERGKAAMQPARLEPLSEARSAPRPEPWAAFLGLPEILDVNPKRFVGKTAKASRRRFIERIALN